MTGSRRRYGSSFKIEVVRKVESGLSAAQVARRFQLNPHLVYKWLRLYRENPEKAFKRGGSREFKNLDAEARIAELERKVGSLIIYFATMEPNSPQRSWINGLGSTGYNLTSFVQVNRWTMHT